jgi:hypothetical protein
VHSQDPTQLIDDGITGLIVPGEAEAVAAIGRRVGASFPFDLLRDWLKERPQRGGRAEAV